MQEPVRIGIVGCGVVATAYYLPYLLDYDGAEITAVCDRDARRVDACAKLYGAKHKFTDYEQMLDEAELDAVLILTAPGTHVRFSLAAIERGIHLLIQKPMALTLDEATTIVDAVRKYKVKCVVEPSANTLLDADTAHMRELIEAGVLGDPYWFSYTPTAGTEYSAMLGGNPYGNKAFFSADSGGALFDHPYFPTQIVALLGGCRAVTASAVTSVPDRMIVPDDGYTDFLCKATDPRDCNYWDEVMHLPKTEAISMGAPDNIFSVYELDAGWTGTVHIGRPFHPMPAGIHQVGLQVFGKGGNLISGGPGHSASIISDRRDLLPHTDDKGWYHIPTRGDHSKAQWPKPVPGAFNYYAESTKHLCECIRQDCEPIPSAEFHRHITEMMWGALESQRTGCRYVMTTTPTGLRSEAASGTPS